MQNQSKDILQGVVISKFGDMGPQALAWYPNQFDDSTLSSISIKAVSILAGEDGFIPPPDSLSVLPIPKIKMTAVVYVFEVLEPEARGSVITATITVLFNEKYTSVIYKTMEELTKLVTPVDKFIEPIQTNADMTNLVKERYNEIKVFLETRRKEEATRYQITGEPQKQYQHEYAYKIIVIGDPRVGKTTLILRFVDKAFRELYIPTIGVQVSLKYLENQETSSLTKLNLWDIAGQEIFNKVRGKFYAGAHAVLIIYDQTNPKTFKNVETWYTDMVNAIGKKPGFLIGNKIDLPRQINKLDAKQLADQLDLEFIETSAKSGENVDHVFERLTERLIKKI